MMAPTISREAAMVLQPDHVAFSQHRKLIAEQPRRLQLLAAQADDQRFAHQVGMQRDMCAGCGSGWPRPARRSPRRSRRSASPPPRRPRWESAAGSRCGCAAPRTPPWARRTARWWRCPECCASRCCHRDCGSLRTCSRSSGGSGAGTAVASGNSSSGGSRRQIDHLFPHPRPARNRPVGEPDDLPVPHHRFAALEIAERDLMPLWNGFPRRRRPDPFRLHHDRHIVAIVHAYEHTPTILRFSLRLCVSAVNQNSYLKPNCITRGCVNWSVYFPKVPAIEISSDAVYGIELRRVGQVERLPSDFQRVFAVPVGHDEALRRRSYQC